MKDPRGIDQVLHFRWAHMHVSDLIRRPNGIEACRPQRARNTSNSENNLVVRNAPMVRMPIFVVRAALWLQ